MKSAADGHAFAEAWPNGPEPEDTARGPLAVGQTGAKNPLEEFFDARTEGRGIHKWRHYFEIYDRHLGKFVGEQTNLLEIGIAGGGSLDMWRQYLGPDCNRYGVDIDPACKKVDDAIVFIGDQSDRAFWKRFRAETPLLDIVIDDGGHTPKQQVVTLEELLPHLRPGGVYICEDIHGDNNPTLGYMYGLSRGLFTQDIQSGDANLERALWSPVTRFQSAIHSLHVYPWVVVIERRHSPLDEFVAPKHGTDFCCAPVCAPVRASNRRF